MTEVIKKMQFKGGRILPSGCNGDFRCGADDGYPKLMKERGSNYGSVAGYRDVGSVSFDCLALAPKGIRALRYNGWAYSSGWEESA